MIWRDVPVQTAAMELAERLEELLEIHDQVLWLVSGGSAVGIQADILHMLPAHSGKLVILPVDERFGPYDHGDSNAAQLRAAGFGPELIDILAGSPSFADAVSLFTVKLRKLTKDSDYIFATLGMGADGHIAGALPGSLAVSSFDMAAGYEGPDFTRFSATLAYLKKCDEIAVLVYGGSKAAALERLRENRESVIDLPAAALYGSGNVTIYNEIYGG